jgi:dynein heavy chain, axonemal
MRNPPAAIKILMECLCLILGVEPIKAKAKDGNIEKDYWIPSVGKQVLGNARLVDILS